MRNTKRSSISVGEMLKVEFLEPLDITPKALAETMGVDINIISNLLNGDVLTAPVAIKLAAALENTPEFWMNIQNAVNLKKSLLNIEDVDLDLSASEIVSIVKGDSSGN